jgi:hypothetical protein
MKKAPNKKRETAACGSACLRAAAPPSSLASFLSSFGGCAASFSCPLRASLSSCGRLRRPSSLLLLSRFFRAAAPPYPFRFSSASLPLLRRLRRLTLPRALVGGWRRPLAPLSFLSIKQLTILSVTVTCHKLFFFCHNNIFLVYHCVTYGDVALSRHTEHAPSALALRNVNVLGYRLIILKHKATKFFPLERFFLWFQKLFVPL